MKIQRALAAAALMLTSGGLYAYHIVEGRYRVETSPGVFQDQLVVRCDDGRTLTVPWETKLAQACNENLMGDPAPKAAAQPQAPSAPQAAAAPPPDAVQKAARPAPDAPVATNATTDAASTASTSLLDAPAQKEAMLAQVRAQFGNVPEHYIEFKPGADGLSMRFLPPLSDLLKKYETCRRARDLSADCAAERDRALARLADNAPQTAALKPEKTPAGAKRVQAPAADAPAQPARNPEVPVQPDSGKQAALPPLAVAPDRAAVEQKIGEDYAWCMRAKPKFECEQARAKALSELDKPKPGKAKRPGKQAGVTPKVAAAR